MTLFLRYELMTKCWYYCPERRPTFNDLVSWTEMMLRSSADYLDLSPSIFQNALYLQPISHSNLELDLVLNKPYETLTYSPTKENSNAKELVTSCDSIIPDLDQILVYPDYPETVQFDEDDEDEHLTENDIFLPTTNVVKI